MGKTKYSFDDIKIGDKIVTTNNEHGEVVAIKSYTYLNDKILRNAAKTDVLLIDLMPFKYDSTRHNGVWYGAITLAVLDKTVSKPTYYLLDIDLTEIKTIVKDMSNVNVTFIDKIKKLFGK